MKKLPFSWLALGLGLVVAAVLQQAGAFSVPESHALPLLTLLIVCEFGFFVTAIGAITGMRSMVRQGIDAAGLAITLGCGMLASGFLYLGISLWPGSFPG